MPEENWQRGRGRLGVLAPLLGAWVAEGESEAGPYRCERRFERALHGSYVELRAEWRLPGGMYDEVTLHGYDRDGELRFWSFTSDGRQTTGWRVTADDLPHPGIAFAADLPAGRARFAYLAPPEGGLLYVAESQTARGWNRFVEHRYVPLAVSELLATNR
jgi:hypothetical protein